MSKIKIVPTNDIQVCVDIIDAGNYGCIRIGGQSRSAKEEYSLAEEIAAEIDEKIDDIGNVWIQQKKHYEVDNVEYEEFSEALAAATGLDFPGDSGFRYRYERPSDNGVGTTGYKSTFKELCEEAYNHPHKFSCNGCDKEQQEFIDAILQLKVKEKLSQ